MIDCNSMTLPPQRDLDSASPAVSAGAATDEKGKNFLNLLEEGTITEEEITADDEQENSQWVECKDASWLGHWFSLTHAQQAELTTPLTDHSLPSRHAEGQMMKAAMHVKAQPALSEGHNLASLIQENRAKKKPDLTHPTIQADNNKDQTPSSRTGDILKPAPLDAQSAQRSRQSTKMMAEHALSHHQGAMKSLEPHANQSSLFKQADFSHLAIMPQRSGDMMEASRKIPQNTPASPMISGGMTIDRLDNIEIIRSRQQGDLTILQLQLNPEHLGRIDAKLRMDESQLRVELMVEQQQTARLLEKDQKILAQVLEKAGFNQETRLSIHIVERGIPQLQAVDLGTGNMNEHNEFGQEGQKNQTGWEQAESDGGFSSQEGKRNRSTPHEETMPRNFVEAGQSAKPSLKRHEYALGSMHRLIV